MLFLAQAPFARTPSGPGLLALLGDDARLFDQLAQLVDAIGAVAVLVAEALRRNDHLPRAGEETLEQERQPNLDLFGDGLACRDVPGQDGPRGHLVHVLAARSSGARELPRYLVVGQGDLVIDAEHGESLGRHGSACGLPLNEGAQQTGLTGARRYTYHRAVRFLDSRPHAWMRRITILPPRGDPIGSGWACSFSWSCRSGSGCS